MCYPASCDPRCGKCRPRRIVEVDCPACGYCSSITREEFLVFFGLPHKRNVMEMKILEHGGVETPRCPMCGTDLSEVFRVAVPATPCRANRVVCGFPCGRCDDPYNLGHYGMHHLCIWADDVDAVKDEFERVGIEAAMELASSQGLKVVYFDARAQLGSFIEVNAPLDQLAGAAKAVHANATSESPTLLTMEQLMGMMGR